MLAQLDVDAQSVARFIGDGFYQQQLVQQQIIAATGHKHLGDYTDNQNQYAALINNGVTAAKQFDLNVGTALTEAQMAALTRDIVWLVNETVTLPDGTTQTVLVPQVYLVANNLDVTGTGSVIAGKNVSIDSERLHNSGTLASQSVTIVTADGITNSGTLAGHSVQARTVYDLNNLGGLIQGNAVALSVGGDLNLLSTTQATHDLSGNAQTLDKTSTIRAGTLDAQAGRDLNARAANIEASADATLAAAHDVHLDTVTQSSDDHVAWATRDHVERASSTDTGTRVSAGKNLTITTGHDVNATAAYAQAGDALTVAAGHDIQITAGERSLYANEENTQSQREFLRSRSTHTIDTEQQTASIGSTLSGNTVDIQAAHDVTIRGSTVASTGDVNVRAGNDLNIAASTDSLIDRHYSDIHLSGLGATGGLSYGTSDTKTTAQDTQTRAHGSLIGSTGGDVRLAAGADLHASGSQLIAKRHVSGAGANITLDAATATRDHTKTVETDTSGFTLGLAGTVGDAVNATIQQAQAISNGEGDPRATALHAIALAGNAAMAATGAAGAMGGATGGKTPSVSVQLSYGETHSEDT
ncbi:hemagglutinin repeat-containing protein, partial [Pararobbsia silviterrae]